MRMKLFTGIVVVAFTIGVASAQQPKILSVDHTVTVKSLVPVIAGQNANIYVRERVQDGRTVPAADRARSWHAG
jgi:hypothetical protein